jgi:hypothetical protein
MNRLYYWKLIGPGWDRLFVYRTNAEAYAKEFVENHKDHAPFAVVFLLVVTPTGAASKLDNLVVDVFLGGDADTLPTDMHDGLTVDGVTPL